MKETCRSFWLTSLLNNSLTCVWIGKTDDKQPSILTAMNKAKTVAKKKDKPAPKKQDVNYFASDSDDVQVVEGQQWFQGVLGSFQGVRREHISLCVSLWLTRTYT